MVTSGCFINKEPKSHSGESCWPGAAELEPGTGKAMAEEVHPGKTAKGALAFEMFSHLWDLVGRVCWKVLRREPC